MAVGDELWAWQSQQPDGSWSIISLGLTPVENAPIGRGPRYEESEMAAVLVHRNRDRMTDAMARQAVLMHRRQFGQPVRLVKLTVEAVEELRPAC